MDNPEVDGDFEYDSDYMDFVSDDSGDMGGYQYGPNLEDYTRVIENTNYTNPWDVADIYNDHNIRIDSNSVINLDVDRNLKSISYRGKTYSRETLVKLAESLGGSESDLDVPYVTRVVDGMNVKTVDSLQYSAIIAQLLDNPC